MDNRETLATMDTRHKTKTNKTKNTTQKTKNMSNADSTNKPGVNPGARKNYQFLFLKRYPPYYSYSNLVKVLLVIALYLHL